MYRERQRSARDPLSCQWRWWNSKSSPIPPPSQITKLEAGGSDEYMRDFVTKGFRKKQAKGEVFSSPLVHRKNYWHLGDNGWKVQSTAGGITYYGECTGNWMSAQLGLPNHLSIPASTLAIELESDTACWAAVVKPDVQIGVTTAELLKTLRMLRSPFKAIIDLVRKKELSYRYIKGSRKTRNVTRRKPTKAETINAAESSWLEARYGWRPLLNEIEAILEALQKEFPPRLVARAKRSQTDSETATYISNHGVFSIPYTVVTTRSTTVRSGILYDYSTEFDNTFGTTWRDMPGTMYQLVPFSFVVGWFINIESFLEALVPKQGIRHLAMWRTVKQQTVTTRTTGSASINPGYSGWSVTRSPGATESVVTNSTTRSPVLYSPALTFKTGSLQAVLQDARSLDILAILLQTLKGKPLAHHRV